MGIKKKKRIISDCQELKGATRIPFEALQRVLITMRKQPHKIKF